MRDVFHEELERINLALVSLGGQIKQALDSATHALLTADLSLAEKVIADDDLVDNAQHQLDAQTIDQWLDSSQLQVIYALSLHLCV